MGIMISAIKIIIVLGTLITIHELGHFLVAKACNVKVHKFAIGFGPRVWKKQGKETEYTLRLIPFGGFVQLEGEEERSEDARAFNNKPIYQRILIVAAGATVNIIFALVVYFFVVQSANTYYGTQIVSLPETSYEYVSGLRSGDTVLKVNNKNMLVGYDITDSITDSKKDDFKFEILRGGEKKDITVNIPISKKGLLGIAYNVDKQIVSLVSGAPAATSGLESGDVILEINNTKIEKWQDISGIISKVPDSNVTIKVLRNNEEKTYDVKTISTSGRFYTMEFEVVHPTGISVVLYALNETFDYLGANLKGIFSIFVGKSENVEVMGPVGIANQIASTERLRDFFYLMAAISLSLGIFNLFPVPALDGGKILLLIIEKIRRKPFSEKTEMTLTLVGFSLIILLALVVTVSDVVGLF